MKLEDAHNFWRSRGVPEDSLDDLSDLAEAARYNDARAEEAHGPEANGSFAFLSQHGWHEGAIRYIAEQRAMRAAMLTTRDGEAALREFARAMEPAILRGLSPAAQLQLMMAWIDGFATAITATELKAKRG